MFKNQYVAHQKLDDGRYVTGIGKTFSEAINNCIEMVEWLKLNKHQKLTTE